MTHARAGLWLLAGGMFCLFSLLAIWGAWGPVAAQSAGPHLETATITATPTATESTPTPTATSTATETLTPTPTTTETATPTPTEASSESPTATPTATSTQAPGSNVYLPLLSNPEPTDTPTVTATPTATVVRAYDSIPVASGGLDRPAAEHPDINLALRSYTTTVTYLGLVNYGGDTDENAPQLAAMFAPARLPPITDAYQVYDWDWSCSPPTGCRGNPINWPYPVSLIALATTPGETISIPSRAPDIYQRQYRAMVLYAEAGRITLAYTRADTAAVGYLVHLEDLTVAPQLVELYQTLDAAGRHRLPGLRNGEVIGVATGAAIKAAVRDTGMFMDPRACKDWWTAYMGECQLHLPRPRY